MFVFLKSMNYILQIEELVSHSRIPDWALRISAFANTWFGKYPIDSRDSVLNEIKRYIVSMSIVIRNSVTTDNNIPVVTEDNTLTVYSLTGKKELLRFSFSPTEQELNLSELFAGIGSDENIKQIEA